MSCVLIFRLDSIRRMFSSRVPKRLSIPRTMGTLTFIYGVSGYLGLRMNGRANQGRNRSRAAEQGIRKSREECCLALALTSKFTCHLRLIIAKAATEADPLPGTGKKLKAAAAKN